MTTYNISNWTELVSGSYGDGDTLNFTADFVTGDNSSVINLNNATLNGNGHTITFSGRTKGLFQVHGATIDDLHLDGNGTTIAANEAFY